MRAVLALPLLLAACQPAADSAPEATQLSLDEIRLRHELPLASPDTARGVWRVAEGNRAITFGNSGASPWLTLECRLAPDQPPVLAIIRHAPGRAGQSALFAVMGNGEVARLPAEPVIEGASSHWEASLPAADPRLDLFIGPGDMRATLPGKGAIAIPPSPVPGQFVQWCRTGGRG